MDWLHPIYSEKCDYCSKNDWNMILFIFLNPKCFNCKGSICVTVGFCLLRSLWWIVRPLYIRQSSGLETRTRTCLSGLGVLPTCSLKASGSWPTSLALNIVSLLTPLLLLLSFFHSHLFL